MPVTDGRPVGRRIGTVPTVGPTAERRRARRRLGYLPTTLRARWGVRPGPTPTGAEEWGDVLRGWIDRQADRLATDVLTDREGRPVRPVDVAEQHVEL